MLRTNKERLVKQSVQGSVHHPLGGAYRISHEGEPRILPATGGICYNVRVGDSAFGFEGDHIEPGVSLYNDKRMESDALMRLACIGNEAKILTGGSRGKKGFVTGTHGGIEHVLLDFDTEIMEDMSIGDRVLIKSYGQGLKLLDYPDVKVMNIDPDLFEKLPIKEENGQLIVDVKCEVPAYLMGSGIGSASAYTGDYDIMTADQKAVKENNIDSLCFGDLVLLKNCDNTFGRGYLEGAVSIGVVVHSDCIKMGHGPGVTTIMTCKTGIIKGNICDKAEINIANLK